MPPETSPATAIVAPTGAIDLTSSRDLASHLAELAGNSGDAVLDLTEVEVLDSMGLGVVLKGATRFHRQGKQLVLVVPPGGNVERLLELAGVRDRLPTAATRDEALARLAER